MSWGLSRLMGAKAGVLLICSIYTNAKGFPITGAFILYYSMLSLLVSISSIPSIDLPSILCKTQQGTFPLPFLLLFSPFLFFVRSFSSLRRWRSREDPFTEIHRGVYVGGWPSSPHKLPPGNPAVVDCTCELPRSSFLSLAPYLTIPVWDTRAPSPSQIHSAVSWSRSQISLGRPLFIHCAYGHGRSVCVMCALLVELNVAEDLKKAENIIIEKRSSAKMNTIQRKALEEWYKTRSSFPMHHPK